MGDENWKETEKIVAIIERSIDPTSKIEMNVRLPKLTNPKRKIECDVVIRKGVKPRETITIVEVQDRKTKVKPNDFRGWVLKMRDVGAQHLICVSKQKFPKSIIENAKEYGNSVYLINLSDDACLIPLSFLGTKFKSEIFDIKYSKIFFVRAFKPFPIGFAGDEIFQMQLYSHEEVFSFDGKTFISFYKLARDFYYHKSKENVVLKDELEIGNDGMKPLFYKNGIYLFRIHLQAVVEYEFVVEYLPVNHLSYIQNDEIQAWMLHSTTKKGDAGFKLPIIKNGDKFTFGQMEAIIPANSELNISFRQKE